MTVVVALTTQSGSYMGADSISVDDDGLYTISNTPKVKQIGDLLVGFAGSWRGGYLAMKSLERLANPSVEQFVNQYPNDEKGWSLLVIEKGKIYEIDDDKSVTEIKGDKDGAYGAIGSGTAVALGVILGGRCSTLASVLRDSTSSTIAVSSGQCWKCHASPAQRDVAT